MNECEAFAYRVKNIYIEHKQVLEVWKMLDSMRSEVKDGSNPRNLFIVGKSGVGKSEILKTYAKKNPDYIMTDSNGNEIDIKKILYVVIPSQVTFLEFFQSIVEELGAPHLFGRPTIGEVKRQVFKLLESQRVELLILDELDNILDSRYARPSEIMETIKYISNLANVPIVCSGTTRIENLRTSNFQIYRRFIRKVITEFSQCDEEFCKLLKGIEEQIKPIYPINMGELDTSLPQLFHALSKGLVGVLTPLIQQAYRELGVFDIGFNDIRMTKLNQICIKEAYKTVGGDIDEAEFLKMMNPRKIY